ncbi:peptidyl-tRNA hydrolase 2, mitochondrial-like [Oscarella lobularis]|uniref:peptidyl-tRNA hydrolase 2, mitochondrial-like n=1 Tax=Oscarella lobularis TaxID=121494 RepID=UPI0033144D47
MDASWPYIAAVLGCGFGLGWLLRGYASKIPNAAAATADLTDKAWQIATSTEEYKLVLVVRNDLKMGKGKVAAQCSHATLHCYKAMLKRDPKTLGRWETTGQAKVVLKATDEKELDELSFQARQAGLEAGVIRDAGRTQIAAGSKTVLGVGPGPAQLIDRITGHLKLY